MLIVDIQHPRNQFDLQLNLVIPPGITAVFGASGAGKTTFLNLIAGLETPQQGRICLNDRVLSDRQLGIHQSPQSRHIGYVFQESLLFPHMNVRKNLEYGFRTDSLTSKKTLEFEQIVTLLELKPLLNRRPNELSGGEKQRVAIGRALLRQPELMLLDEPLASLDVPRKQPILTFLKQIWQELGIPMIYVSHHINEILQIAEDLVFLEKGQCLLHEKVTEALNHHELQRFYGLEETGTILEAELLKHDLEHGLSVLRHFSGQWIYVPQLSGNPGSIFRVRILPRDVALSLTKPENSSVLNVFSGTVRRIVHEPPCYADILLDIGGPLWSRITQKSCERLALAEDMPVYAMIKSVAILGNY
ncbi:MAG: molybdenum ABC transporter ATP-binding protein [SAR324 cluster bacterium]|nr:molybdenum ABC transporter ATP-binding protein [SAR324 cluster bacterium]